MSSTHTTEARDRLMARWIVGGFIILMAAYMAGSLIPASREIQIQVNVESTPAFP